ncbi:MAG: thioredoxin-like domain-containing protein [Chloroflexota bacterium]
MASTPNPGEKGEATMTIPMREPVRAPELAAEAWINTDHPLRLADLRGNVVLLDFFTYCCINCLHVLPDLAYLEAKYAGEPFVVVGIHSPKFPNEERVENVRDAVARHGIAHPVAVDPGRRIWDAYAVRGWPTLVLVDPRGYLRGTVSGEGHRDLLDRAIGEALAAYRAGGALGVAAPIFRQEHRPTDLLPLAYPGKVLADLPGDRLFIADSGHHRLVIARLDGTPLEIVGTGTPGAADGPFESATFHGPQGMALDGEMLYVADTGNHLVRRLDLRARAVETVAGTGSQGPLRRGEGPALSLPLNSPWDLCLLPATGPGRARILAIAMAGSHQLWQLDPGAGTLAPLAGSGREAREDGLAPQAAFAQPSGLASDGATQLYVADSEISAIRAVTLGAGMPAVTTLAGGDLFVFGDTDGVGDRVRLQHPLGVAYGAGRVYVADTNNHALRVAAARGGSVPTLDLAGRGLCPPGLCLPGRQAAPEPS